MCLRLEGTRKSLNAPSLECMYMEYFTNYYLHILIK